ncbi:MAG: hypothetical protein ACR2FN_00760 [Chitinophagaceae bacterium]
MRNFLLLIITLLAVFYFCFTPLLKLDFFYGSDDDWILLKNPEVYNFSLTQIPKYFTTVYNGQYSPINTIFYGLIFRIDGYNAFNFHLVLLVFHSINAILVFLLIILLLNLSSFSETHKFIISYFCALMFYVHPIQIESFGWISASKVILYTFFILLSLIAYIKFLLQKLRYYYYFSIVLFLLACGSKEQAVILPLLLLLVDYHYGVLSIKILLLKIPFFLISIALGLCQLNFQKLSGTPVIINHTSFQLLTNVWLSMCCIGEYYLKIILPVTSCNEGISIVSDEILNKYQFLYFIIFVCLFYITHFAIRKNKKEIVFGIIFTFITLLLTLPIFPIARSTFLADRYTYLGCVGLIYTVVIYSLSQLQNRKVLKIFLIVFYVFYLFVSTYYTCQKWSKVNVDKKTFKQ